MISVYIVDNQIIDIECLSIVLSVHQELKVIGYATSGQEAIDRLSIDQNIDIVIMDLLMPSINGLQTMKKINEKRKDNKLKFLMYTLENSWDIAVNAVDTGASGYMVRTSSTKNLIDAIIQIHKNEGAIVIDSNIKRPSTSPNQVRLIPDFNENEMRIIELLVQGATSIEIAKKIFKKKVIYNSTETPYNIEQESKKQDRINQTKVETIVDIIKAKVGVKNIAHLVRYVLENGLCSKYEIYKNEKNNIPKIEFLSHTVIPFFVIDDQAIMSEGLSILLANHQENLEFINKGSFTDGDEGIEFIKNWMTTEDSKKHEQFLLLLDINMPGKDGIEVAKILRDHFKNIKIIFLTFKNNYDLGFRLLGNKNKKKDDQTDDLGSDEYIRLADAFVHKNTVSSDLIKIIKAVWQGHTYLGIPKPEESVVFTDEQLEVLKHIWNGLDRSEITLKLLKLANGKEVELKEDDLKKQIEIVKKRVDGIRNNIMLKIYTENTAALINYIWRYRIYEKFTD